MPPAGSKTRPKLAVRWNFCRYRLFKRPLVFFAYLLFLFGCEVILHSNFDMCYGNSDVKQLHKHFMPIERNQLTTMLKVFLISSGVLPVTIVQLLATECPGLASAKLEMRN